jgi:hypothetical protein
MLLEELTKYYPKELSNIIEEYILGTKKYRRVLSELGEIINKAKIKTFASLHVRIMNETETYKYAPYAYNIHVENLFMRNFLNIL